jgi:hypothetical protein
MLSIELYLLPVSLLVLLYFGGIIFALLLTMPIYTLDMK